MTPEMRTARALLKLQGSTVSILAYSGIALDAGHTSPAGLLQRWLVSGLVTVDGDTITFNRRALEAVAGGGC
jgi:hypothetical protein